jgi:iron complex transport system permease protein
MVLAAFTGSMLIMGFVLLFSRYTKSMPMLLVVGIMVGYICSAITNFFITFAKDNDIANLTSWSMGSFSGAAWSNLGIICVIVGISLLLSILLSKPMDAYRLGEGYAKSMGINIRLFRAALIVISSVLSACVTAFAGPISFVGIAVPQITKLLMKSGKPLVIIPTSFLCGAVFCLFCDLIARTAFAPTELAIGTVTSLFGAPVVIAMMVSRKRERI